MIRRGIGWPLSALVFSAVATIGCQRAGELDWKYGHSTGAAGDTVAGASLLADQFARNRYRVVTARTLGRVIEGAKVVVWFPDRFEPPSDATCRFFNDWLAGGSGRSLIYVGRDFDVTSAYWQRLLSDSPGNELAIRQRLAQSRATWASRQSPLPATASCAWFTIHRDQGPVQIRNIEGPLRGAFSSSPHQLVLHNRIKVTNADADARVLLYVERQPLITEYKMPYWQQSRLLIVTNASPLLNLGMTYPAHQQLAQQLIDSCGGPAGSTQDRCVFLTSGANDPMLADEAEMHHLVRIFTTPPFSSVLMHLSVLGLIYCFAVYPMFGRARSLDWPDETDFGRHVEALGRLLARTNDSLFAQGQRQDYLHQVVGQPHDHASGDNPFRQPAGAERTEEVAES